MALIKQCYFNAQLLLSALVVETQMSNSLEWEYNILTKHSKLELLITGLLLWTLQSLLKTYLYTYLINQVAEQFPVWEVPPGLPK